MGVARLCIAHVHVKPAYRVGANSSCVLQGEPLLPISIFIATMEDFILCKADDGSVIEVDIDDDGTVSLETLRSLFGPNVSALTYTNPLTGRDRVVKVSDEKLIEPKDGWRASDRTYSVSYGYNDARTPIGRQSQPPLSEVSISDVKITPRITPTSRRALAAHPLIKRESELDTSKENQPGKYRRSVYM